MLEPRFRALRESLLRGGVAAAHAQRAAIEIQSHFHQSVDAALARGAGSEDALLEAHAQLGCDQAMIERFLSQPELQSWMSRQALYFTIFPLLSFVALALLIFFTVWVFLEPLEAYLHRIRVPLEVSHRIALGTQVTLLWIAPILISAAFAIVAFRQRVALRWPVMGTLALCAFVSLVNVELVVTGGAKTPAVTSAGIGVSLSSLPGEAARAAAMALLVLAPLWLAVRRLRRQSAG